MNKNIFWYHENRDDVIQIHFSNYNLNKYILISYGLLFLKLSSNHRKVWFLKYSANISLMPSAWWKVF